VSSYCLARMMSASTVSLAAVVPLDLVDVPAIAEMLKVGRRTAWRYIERDDFPPPEAEMNRKRLWKRSAVERWANRSLPLKFDPRSKGGT
jgi:predicted DNA-binding transcriptional regulator AlpA